MTLSFDGTYLFSDKKKLYGFNTTIAETLTDISFPEWNGWVVTFLEDFWNGKDVNESEGDTSIKWEYVGNDLYIRDHFNRFKVLVVFTGDEEMRRVIGIGALDYYLTIV